MDKVLVNGHPIESISRMMEKWKKVIEQFSEFVILYTRQYSIYSNQLKYELETGFISLFIIYKMFY